MTDAIFRPNKYQSISLDKIREWKDNKGIVVLPTGVGKTYLSALWVQKKLKQEPNANFLFICHNRDILLQAKDREFKHLLPDLDSGMYSSTEKDVCQLTFATIQTLANYYKNFNPIYFDYIIVDEVHHYQAKTWKRVIRYFKPKFLFGLTATPHRNDDRDIRSVCGKFIDYVTLKDAIHSKMLSKIVYYCVDNNIDYSEVKYNGRNYCEKDLNKKICISKYDDKILKEYKEIVVDKFGKKKTVCFCPTMLHARRMEKIFNNDGISAVSLVSSEGYKVYRNNKIQGYSYLSKEKRSGIIDSFKRGDYDIIFVVDMFNEGIDIPSADCVMMLRPTQSSIIFSQQIGRGVRKIKGKKNLLILDFVENARKNYLNYEFLNILMKDNFQKLFSQQISGKVNFIPEELVINHYGQEIRLNKSKIEILTESINSLESAVYYYQRVFNDEKPTRMFLKDKYPKLYYQFRIHNQLDVFCRTVHINWTEEKIRKKLKQIFRQRIPTPVEIKRGDERVFDWLCRNNKMEKYAKSKFESWNEEKIVKRIKELFGDKKPAPNELYKKDARVTYWLQQHHLTKKYCDYKYSHIDEDYAKKELKRLFGKRKPSSAEVKRGNRSVLNFIYRKGLQKKYLSSKKYNYRVKK